MKKQTIESTVKLLTNLGYVVLTIDDESEDTDAVVWLTGRLGIQVPSFGGGLCVVIHDGDGDDWGVRCWDVTDLSRLPATLATAETFVRYRPLTTDQIKKSPAKNMLESAARRLLEAHQDQDDTTGDKKRDALETLRIILNA